MAVINLSTLLSHWQTILSVLVGIAATTGGLRFKSEIRGPFEVCQRQIFNATCSAGEVIVMIESLYGRPQIGKCMTRNLGFLGCKTDVIRHIDAICSGRQQCAFEVPDDTLANTMACPKDVSSFLKASYRCVKVATATRHVCHSRSTLTLTPTEGYLSSWIADKSGHGSTSCPWVIKADPGQKINLTLWNFLTTRSSSGSGSGGARTDVCYEIAIIKEGSTRKTISSCHQDREKMVYMSSSNVVEVVMPKRNKENLVGEYLFQYAVTGCGALRAPSGTTVTVKEGVATVRCNDTNETWFLQCQGAGWVGRLGNCSRTPCCNGQESQWFGSVLTTEEDFPYGILIAVAMGVALGVFLGGLLLTLVVLHSKRKRRAKERRQMQQAESTLSHQHGYPTATLKYSTWRPEGKLLPTDTGTGTPTRIVECPQHINTGQTVLANVEVDSAYGGYDSTVNRQRPHMYESPKFV